MISLILNALGLVTRVEHERLCDERFESLENMLDSKDETIARLTRDADGLSDRLNSVFGVDDWKAQGYKTREEEINDMANVGRSLMDRIADCTETGAEMSGWHPMDDPAEIVTDMANTIYELRSERDADQADAQKWRDYLKRSRDRKKGVGNG